MASFKPNKCILLSTTRKGYWQSFCGGTTGKIVRLSSLCATGQFPFSGLLRYRQRFFLCSSILLDLEALTNEERCYIYIRLNHVLAKKAEVRLFYGKVRSLKCLSDTPGTCHYRSSQHTLLFSENMTEDGYKLCLYQRLFNRHSFTN